MYTFYIICHPLPSLRYINERTLESIIFQGELQGTSMNADLRISIDTLSMTLEFILTICMCPLGHNMLFIQLCVPLGKVNITKLDRGLDLVHYKMIMCPKSSFYACYSPCYFDLKYIY